MVSIRRSFAWSFLDRYSLLVIQFGTSMLLARLVTPAEFGVFSLAFAIVGFAHRIREMGVASYLVRKPDLRPVHIRSALFATGIVAWGLVLVLYALLPVVDRLYGPDVRRATLVLLLNFIIMPLSSTITPVLQREMNFGLLLWINTAGVLANSLCAIVLAELGGGYMALAWGSVAGQVAIVAVAAAMRPHREHFAPSLGDVRNVFRFGSALMLGTLLQQFSTNAANLIMARFVTLNELGLYNRAQSVTGLYQRLIMQAISPLVLPVLSMMHRKGDALAPACRQGFAYLLVITWPFFGFLALFADPIVIVLFGHQWDGTVILLRLLAVAGMLEIVQPIAEPLLIAVDKVGLMLRAQTITQIVAILAVLVAATQGIEAVAVSWLLVSIVHSITWIYYLRKVVPLRVADLLRTAAVGACVTAAALVLPLIALQAATGIEPLARVLLGGAGLAVGWIGAVFAIGHPFAGEIRLVVRRLVPAER